MILVWSVATGKDPSKFYETNTVHNTGDDNIWGTDDNIDPDELAAIARDWLGLTMRIEGRGDITDLTYLGKVIRRASETPDTARVRHAPRFVAAPMREQFLLRRSAVVSRFSGLPERAYFEKMIERSVGHLRTAS